MIFKIVFFTTIALFGILTPSLIHNKKRNQKQKALEEEKREETIEKMIASEREKNLNSYPRVKEQKENPVERNIESGVLYDETNEGLEELRKIYNEDVEFLTTTFPEYFEN